MRVLKVPDEIAGQYHGCGWALGVIEGDKLVKITYISDIDPQFDDKGAHAEFFARQHQTIHGGTVGMLSCWEFCITEKEINHVEL